MMDLVLHSARAQPLTSVQMPPERFVETMLRPIETSASWKPSLVPWNTKLKSSEKDSVVSITWRIFVLQEYTQLLDYELEISIAW